MLGGQTADDNRNPVVARPPGPGSLEAIGYGACLAARYLDTSAR